MAQFAEIRFGVSSLTIAEINKIALEEYGHLSGYYSMGYSLPRADKTENNGWSAKLIDRHGCGNQGLVVLEALTDENRKLLRKGNLKLITDKTQQELDQIAFDSGLLSAGWLFALPEVDRHSHCGYRMVLRANANYVNIGDDSYQVKLVPTTARTREIVRQGMVARLMNRLESRIRYDVADIIAGAIMNRKRTPAQRFIHENRVIDLVVMTYQFSGWRDFPQSGDWQEIRAWQRKTKIVGGADISTPRLMSAAYLAQLIQSKL